MPDVSSGGLPRPLTSFIGRERELAQARRLLAGSYLVTLTGPGGSGKTRLCIALAAEVAGDYPDGVYFVPLAPVRDPDLVPSTIAQSLGLQDARDRPLMDHLVSQLNERQVLLVLDNFEHLLAGRARRWPGCSGRPARCAILVSSRSSLRISGEQECPVPPLALELAAARVKLLPPEAILARLEHSLRLLTGGGRDLPDRQQTLRATIAWSHDLLTEGARRLLATCSVFTGGASLEAIETVCDGAADIGLPVLDGLAELLDQNLMRQVRRPGPVRYALLETIREYAAERLDQLPGRTGSGRLTPPRSSP